MVSKNVHTAEKVMKIIRNNLLPVGRQYAAINLFGMLLIKHGVRVTPELINHERIHSAQMRELLYLPFYIAYLAEWLVRLAACRGNCHEAYRAITFEKEAYRHSGDHGYLGRRRHFAHWR